MKKKMLLAVLALGLGVLNINAQGISGGIKADANASNFIFCDMPSYFKSNFGAGASLGGFVKFEIGSNFALQPELLFHYKTSELEDVSWREDKLPTESFQYFGVEIPLYIMGQVKLGNGKLFLGAGPYAGFGIDARSKVKDQDDLNLYEKIAGEDGSKEAALQRFDIGAGAILGYEFCNRISIAATYKRGFQNLLTNPVGDQSYTNQTLSVGLGIRF